MAKQDEYGTKMRLLRIMLALAENQNGYTKKQLAKRYNVHPDTITGDFEALKNVGFLVKMDKKYRYTLRVNKPLQQLKDLLHFSEEDQILLSRAIDQITPHSKSGARLKKKLGSLYDYHRLGHAYLRKPYLSKVDLLFQAKKEKKQVILQDYHSSNSNIVQDRIVEPFHPDPPNDMLQAWDADKNEMRHFRISRITRVKLMDTSWASEQRHLVMPTDPFRIVDNKQEMVHIRMKVGAYNELMERFPLAKSYVTPAAEEEIYDFQCMVNHRFLGLTNFILGYHHQLVEVVEPESLLVKLREMVKGMEF